MKLTAQVIQNAITHAMQIRPKVGGFPYLAEALRQIDVQHNYWHLPACTSIYANDAGAIVQQNAPLFDGMQDVPSFNQEALIAALRKDQAGNSTFPEFLLAAWQAGVIRYTVDFNERCVTYYGNNAESYVEAYPQVKA
ncbi:MAG: DUF1398 family protein [Chlamydiales bacterium]|nr:DUF1398 family protein [Chlamydiales bacterium]